MKPLRRVLDCLERAVLGERALDEPLPHAAHSLMVARAHCGMTRTEDRLEPRALAHVDRVLGEHSERLTMTLVADALGEILDEVTAAENVEQLESPADRERRKVALERTLEQAQLASVSMGLSRVRRGMALGAVPRRIDVDTARKYDPVEE